jgi:hypothetical protein
MVAERILTVFGKLDPPPDYGFASSAYSNFGEY